MNDMYVGDSEVEEMMRQMGVMGDLSSDDSVGATAIGAVVKKLASKLASRVVVPNSAEGRPRGFPLLMGNLQGLADAATSTITGQADRRALLRFLFIEANSAAGALLRGVTLTACTINGRNAVIGSGGIPAHTAFGEFQPPPTWSFGVIEQGGSAIISVLNNAGAAVDVYAGFLAESVD